jgi:hypothetical protein
LDDGLPLTQSKVVGVHHIVARWTQCDSVWNPNVIQAVGHLNVDVHEFERQLSAVGRSAVDKVFNFTTVIAFVVLADITINSVHRGVFAGFVCHVIFPPVLLSDILTQQAGEYKPTDGVG